MTTHAYLFEAKSLQSYILTTNRLKEIVGASELIESLTSQLLDDVVKTVGGQNSIQFSRRASAVFYAFSTDQQAIAKLAALWPLVVRQYAPDLEFIQAQSTGENAYIAYTNAKPKLLAARNAPVARLPQAAPPVKRSRRTGEPAITWHTNKDQDPEPIDAPTARKLEPKFWRGIALGRRLAPTERWQTWPLNLTPETDAEARNFPFADEDETIALIHADGNGLGQLLIKLEGTVKQRPNDYIKIFSSFSNAVTTATQKAAQCATNDILHPNKTDGVYPARPIVLGGDDLTIIIRSDLALAFTRSFLTHFANQSSSALQKLQQDFTLPDLPQYLTACAGIIYAKPTQPLYLLHAVADSLCKHAKSKSKAQDPNNIPSSLSFHRITTSFIDADYTEVLKRELTFDELRQTLECYALEPNQGLPALNDLLALRNLLNNAYFAKGSARELLGLIGRDRDQAIRQYRRWREIVASRAPSKLKQFDELLFALGVTQASADLPYSGSAQSRLRRTPLGDVVTLIAARDICTTSANAPSKEATCV